MRDLPTGVLTLLFTDIEGSTRLLHHLGDRYPEVLTIHRDLLRGAFAAHGGVEVDTQGDAFFVAFPSAVEAVAAVVEAQRTLAAHAWPEGGTVRVRMGMHTGEPMQTGEGYAGIDLHRGARIAHTAHGGQVVLSQSTAELVRDSLPAGVSLRAMGEHRLKDLQHPEHLYQVDIEGLPTAFPPLRSLNTRIGNLPTPATALVGRERESGAVQELLEREDGRLVTLTGMGGVGKTRLSLHVAEELHSMFPDGVWFVELAPVVEPALVPRVVASALDMREEPGRALTTTLTDALRDRNLLLVLDNCEHLIAACATLAEALLRGCPKVRILASSREALNIAGERVYRVPTLSLPSPEPGLTAAQALQYEAVRLFVDRAVAVQPSFAITDQNAAAVAQVCHRLDGIALALELAAARVKVLPVEQIAARLDDRFRLLTGGSRTALPRQQTLRALIDWSYDLLSEPERAVLRRFSIFAGGAGLEATETVCAGRDVESWEVLDLLAQLVDKSLIYANEQEGYRMLETVRQYAAEKLREADEEAAHRDRHRDWYLELAVQAGRELRGRDQHQWLERLDREHDNLRAALAWSTERPEQGRNAALQLGSALAPFWYMRGYLNEGRQRLEQVLAVGDAAPAPLRAHALNSAAGLALSQGDYAVAHVRYEECLALFRELGATPRIALVLGNLGVLEDRQGNYAAARPLLEEALALYRQLGETKGIILTLNNLGDLAQKQDDLDAAGTFFDEALVLARNTGDTWSVSIALTGLSDVARKQNDTPAALARLAEALSQAREIGDKLHAAECLARIAGLVARTEPERAARLFGAAEALREAIGASLEPGRQATIEQDTALARSTLSEPEFDAAWASGRAMPLEAAVAYALDELVAA